MIILLTPIRLCAIAVSEELAILALPPKRKKNLALLHLYSLRKAKRRKEMTNVGGGRSLTSTEAPRGFPA